MIAGESATAAIAPVESCLGKQLVGAGRNGFELEIAAVIGGGGLDAGIGGKSDCDGHAGIGHDAAPDGHEPAGQGAHVGVGRLLVEGDFVDAGIADARGFAGEGGQVALVLMLFGEGADEVGAGLEFPDAIDTAIVGSGAAGDLRRAGVAVGDDVVFEEADIVLVGDGAGDGSEAGKPQIEESSGGVFEDNGEPGAVVLLLAILHGGEAAAGCRDEIGSAGQGWKFESARVVGAGGLDGACGAGDRGANDQRVGERVAGLVFHDNAANYRRMRGGRQCEQRPFRHKF